MIKKIENISVDARLDYERQTAKPDDIEFERIKSEEEDYESAPPTYEINTYPADFTLEVLHQKWKDQDIEIPRFQRQFVWKQVQASKLIESFLIGLPVPAVFLYTERKSQKFLVIDGQQRLRSVFYFLEGFFGEEDKGKRTIFQLKGLSDKSKYLGKGYDVELILRFFALLDHSQYQKPMKDFLSKFMKANQDPGQKVIQQFRKLFTTTCTAIVNHIREKPFHIRAGLNSAVLDCVMVSFAKNFDVIPNDINQRYKSLIRDSNFLKNVSSGTTDEDVVKNRFESAEKKLFQHNKS